MPDYAVFGGTLRSELKLVGVPPARKRSGRSWMLRVGTAVPGEDSHLAAAESEPGGFDVRLYRLSGGWRLAYSDTGVYDVTGGGREICWYRVPGATEELVQADVLGRVFALALVEEDILPLHGSAAVVRGHGIVLLGGKHHGKSTLAAALVARGARLVTDDLVAVRAPGTLLPGVPQLRLWQDSAAVMAETAATRTAGVKDTFAGLGAGQVELRERPLDAIYILEAGDPPDGSPCWRDRLAATEAFLALLVQAKLGSLLRGSLEAGHLQHAREVASTVPVYRLRHVRDLTRLDQVCERLAAWVRPRRMAGGAA